MRKQYLFIFLALVVSNTFQAQTRGTKVGYIDMEYILQNVPDYTEAQNQLEQKAQKWKQEIETKKIEINKLKEALKTEKALLTKGLIEERIAEIAFLENENLDYQQKRFGPNGDLMTQKASLTKPIQDQVFTAVQDIAEAKKYDFVFDKTSDLTMLFAAKRFDISDQIIRVLNRTEKREQLTKKQLKEQEAKELKEDAMDENPVLADRQKALDAKKATRDKTIADRVLLQEERKKTAEEKRLQIIADREAKKNGATPATSKTAVTPTNAGNDAEKEATKTAAAEAKQKQLDERALILETRKKAAEDNKKAQEEKRKQIIADREAKKTGSVPAAASTTAVTTSPDAGKEAAKTAAAETKQKQIDAREKTLEDRKKVAEENKKAVEEKRKQVLDEKAKKTGTISESTIKEETKKPDTAVEPVKENTKTAAEEAKQKQIDARAKTIEDRKKVIEERKKALEEKKKKILEDKEAAKKANEEKLKTTKENSNNN